MNTKSFSNPWQVHIVHHNRYFFILAGLRFSLRQKLEISISKATLVVKFHSYSDLNMHKGFWPHLTGQCTLQPCLQSSLNQNDSLIPHHFNSTRSLTIGAIATKLHVLSFVSLYLYFSVQNIIWYVKEVSFARWIDWSKFQRALKIVTKAIQSAFYDTSTSDCRSLIVYATHYLFCCG